MPAVPQWTRDGAREALADDLAVDVCILLIGLRREGAERTENPSTVHWSGEVSLDGEMNSLLMLRGRMRSPEVIA